MSLQKQERRADQCAEHHHSHHILSQVNTALSLSCMVLHMHFAFGFHPWVWQYSYSDE